MPIINNGTIIVDRDGVLNEVRQDYVKNLKELEIIKSSIEAIKMLRKNNFLVVVASNQAGFAKKLVSKETLSEIENNINDLCQEQIAFFYCLHEKSDNCECRKPKPGMLLEIKRRYAPPYIFVGDNITDYEAAKQSNISFALVRTGHGTKYKDILKEKCYIFENLKDFSTTLLRSKRLTKHKNIYSKLMFQEKDFK